MKLYERIENRMVKIKGDQQRRDRKIELMDLFYLQKEKPAEEIFHAISFYGYQIGLYLLQIGSTVEYYSELHLAKRLNGTISKNSNQA